jgi:uncharacterized protein YecT (DUF1311 family)
MRIALAALLFLGIVASVAQAAAVLKPPVIHEPFTPLPCPAHPETTLAEEGCSERVILVGDRAINGEAKVIFGLLGSPGARQAFVQGERAWLSYRRTSCSAEASAYAGGSFQPVAYASCTIARNRTHLADLVAMRRSLSHH